MVKGIHPVSGLYEEILRICDDVQDECRGIRHDLLEAVYDEEQALRDLLLLLRRSLVEVLALLRRLEQESEGYS
jgi:hypothetical protein